ncbi:MAG: hypothetical protein QME73_05760 [Bacillota bacterium]|nr:hypothetical protein [Bacillota bacterium]
MGIPEDTTGFKQFTAGSIQIYVQDKVLDLFLENNRITFYLDEYGRYELELH